MFSANMQMTLSSDPSDLHDFWLMPLLLLKWKIGLHIGRQQVVYSSKCTQFVQSCAVDSTEAHWDRSSPAQLLLCTCCHYHSQVGAGWSNYRHYLSCSTSPGSSHWQPRAIFFDAVVVAHSVVQASSEGGSTGSIDPLPLSRQQYMYTCNCCGPSSELSNFYVEIQLNLHQNEPFQMKKSQNFLGGVTTSPRTLPSQGRLHHINDGANAPWKK